MNPLIALYAPNPSSPVNPSWKIVSDIKAILGRGVGLPFRSVGSRGAHYPLTP